MKVLVTGGSGYLGRHVRQFFGADDLSRTSGHDILKPADASIAANYGLVIHLAAMLDRRPESSEECFRTNTEGTVNLLKAISKDACFIYMSTKDIYGRFADKYQEVDEQCETTYSGQNAYEWSKLIGEKYVEFYARQRGFRAAIFRSSNVYAQHTNRFTGIVGGLVNSLNFGNPIKLPGDGTTIRDYLHVDDLSRACHVFFKSSLNFGLYNIGGGRDNSVSVLQLIEKLEKASGLQAIIDNENSLPAPKPKRYISDLTLAGLEIDWKPQIALDDGLSMLFQPN